MNLSYHERLERERQRRQPALPTPPSPRPSGNNEAQHLARTADFPELALSLYFIITTMDQRQCFHCSTTITSPSVAANLHREPREVKRPTLPTLLHDLPQDP